MRIIFRLPMEVHWLLCRRFREKTGIPETTESLIRWYVQTGSQNKVIVARKFYDGSSEINAVLKITLDYNKLFEPFEKIMESDFAGIVWDENGNVVYSCNKIPAKYETGRWIQFRKYRKVFPV